MGNANSSLKIAEKLDVRKCVFGCGGEMHLAKKIPGGMVWSCPKCFKDISKNPGDYSAADKNKDYPKTKTESE
jgi:hypothetical protein